MKHKTVKEFANLIRKKYPGSYDNISDTDLVNVWIKKYPVYKDQIDFTEPKQDQIGGSAMGKVGSGLGGVGSSADVKNIKSYPPCVQKFGNPTPGKDGKIFSVDGTGEYKGLFFFNNGRYTDGKTIMNYTCKEEYSGGRGGVSYKLILDPTQTSKSGGVSSSKSKSMHYTPCTNLPCQFGTKNPKIREIQTCLGFPLKWQTGNFGPITRKGLKDLQYDISKGITDEIYSKIKANCGSANSSKPEHPPLSPSLNPDETQPGIEGSMYNTDGSIKP